MNNHGIRWKFIQFIECFIRMSSAAVSKHLGRLFITFIEISEKYYFNFYQSKKTKEIT